jgi:3',5'-cyclic-AMP phosphodiesterase
MNREFKRLKVPFITAIGNHDCVGNGILLYQDIYGPLNYSFTWNSIRFVVHNTNSREFNFNGTVPDINWMEQQTADKNKYHGCIFISHVPPSSEDFDQGLVDSYTAVIRNAKNTIFSSNGHRHDYALGQPYNDGVWYLNTSSPSNRILTHVIVTPFSRDQKKFSSTPVTY